MMEMSVWLLCHNTSFVQDLPRRFAKPFFTESDCAMMDEWKATAGWNFTQIPLKKLGYI